MDESDKAERAVLEALALRPDGDGYHELSVEGQTPEGIELMVNLLYGEELVDARFITGGFGPSRDSVQPSTLTTKGRAYLKSLKSDETQGA